MPRQVFRNPKVWTSWHHDSRRYLWCDRKPIRVCAAPVSCESSHNKFSRVTCGLTRIYRGTIAGQAKADKLLIQVKWPNIVHFQMKPGISGMASLPFCLNTIATGNLLKRILICAELCLRLTRQYKLDKWTHLMVGMFWLGEMQKHYCRLFGDNRNSNASGIG